MELFWSGDTGRWGHVRRSGAITTGLRGRSPCEQDWVSGKAGLKWSPTKNPEWGQVKANLDGRAGRLVRHWNIEIRPKKYSTGPRPACPAHIFWAVNSQMKKIILLPLIFMLNSAVICLSGKHMPIYKWKKHRNITSKIAIVLQSFAFQFHQSFWCSSNMPGSGGWDYGGRICKSNRMQNAWVFFSLKLNFCPGNSNSMSWDLCL